MAGSQNSLPLIQLSLQPGVIDLGWGHPDSALMPVEAVGRATRAALDRYGADPLLYGHGAGPGPLREWLAARIGQHEGRTPAPDEILITAGTSQGLDMLLTWAVRPGEVVLVESPTYHLALRILRDRRLDLVPVPADRDGVQVEALRETLAGLRRDGRTARALYLVPTFNNPTGASLSLPRREALAALAAEAGLLLIEDDVYRELAYDGPALPSLWSLAPPGTVARLGTFSKCLAPGLRVGWLTASRELVTSIAESGMLDSGGGISHFAALAVACLGEAGDFEPQVARLRAEYRRRRDALVDALAEHLPPGCAAWPAHGGFFVWVELPPGLNARQLRPRAEAAGVSYVPGDAYFLNGQGSSALRLAFSLFPPADLAEGARRLGAVVRQAL